MFLYHFGMIYRTNLLTRCPVPISVFCYLFVSEKLFSQVSRNQLEIYVNYFHEETRTEPGGRLQGGPTRARCPQARPTPWPRLGPTWCPPTSSRAALSPINSFRHGNPRYPIIFYRKHLRLPASPTLDREGSEALPGTLPEGESSPEASTSPCLPPE